MTQQSHSWAYNPEKNIIQKDSYTPIFTAALCTIAKKWKQTKCPSTDEWIKKWYVDIYYGLLFSHIKRMK